MEDRLSQEKGPCVAVTLMEMTSLESTEQKLLPVICDSRHAYYNMVILFCFFLNNNFIHNNIRETILTIQLRTVHYLGYLQHQLYLHNIALIIYPI